MGTRSLTHIHEGDKTLVTMYRQFDGYPSGHGEELFKFLKDIKIINGISGDADMGTHANGMGCLAAQIISHFKQELGGIYIYPPDSNDCWEEYVYTIWYDKDKKFLMGKIYDVYDKKVLVDGTMEECYNYCVNEGESDD